MRCARCGRPIPKLAVRHGDEFCSAECCRIAHGCFVVRSDWRPGQKGYIDYSVPSRHHRLSPPRRYVVHLHRWQTGVTAPL